jgi:hypothetical protein
MEEKKQTSEDKCAQVIKTHAAPNPAEHNWIGRFFAFRLSIRWGGMVKSLILESASFALTVAESPSATAEAFGKMKRLSEGRTCE